MPSFLYGLSGRRRLPDAEIVRLYLEEDLDGDAVGLRAGCSSTTVLALVKDAGGVVRGRAGRPASYARGLSDAEICHRYRIGESGHEVARAARCTSTTVYQVLDRYGVPRRNRGRPGKK